MGRQILGHHHVIVNNQYPGLLGHSRLQGTLPQLPQGVAERRVPSSSRRPTHQNQLNLLYSDSTFRYLDAKSMTSLQRQSPLGNQVDGKAAQPVSTFVVLACDCGKSRTLVSADGSSQSAKSRVSRG